MVDMFMIMSCDPQSPIIKKISDLCRVRSYTTLVSCSKEFGPYILQLRWKRLSALYCIYINGAQDNTP
jgi:hypothetical protein